MPSGVFIRTIKQPFCSVEGCDNKHRANGLCKKHFNKQYHQDNKEHLLKYKRQWREENPKYMKQYYQENKEENNKQMKQWREEHKEHIAEYGKQYRQDHQEHKAEYNKQWHEENPEYNKQYNKQWRQTPEGKIIIKAHCSNRRAMTKELTKEIVQRVYEDNIKKFGTLTCILCGKPVEFKDSSLEHLTPLSRGGTNNYDNLGIAHLICNIRKNAKTLEEWNLNKQ